MNRHEFLLDPANERFATGARKKLPAAGHGCILLFMSIFVAAGLLIATDLVRKWARVAILSTGYVETRGQVVGRRIESDEGAVYYVAYRFLAGGQEYTLEEIVSKATYGSVEKGGSLAVRYARRNPAVATIQPGQFGGLLILTGFGLVWNGFVFPISWLLAREMVKRRRLAKRGQQVVGELLSCSAERDDGGDRVLKVHFGFVSPHTGLWVVGEDWQPRKDLEGKPLPPAGTPVHVLFLDDKTYLML